MIPGLPEDRPPHALHCCPDPAVTAPRDGPRGASPPPQVKAMLKDVRTQVERTAQLYHQQRQEMLSHAATRVCCWESNLVRWVNHLMR